MIYMKIMAMYNEYYEALFSDGVLTEYRVRPEIGSGKVYFYNIVKGFCIMKSAVYMPETKNKSDIEFDENFSIIHHIKKGEGYISLENGLTSHFTDGDFVIYQGEGKYTDSGTDSTMEIITLLIDRAELADSFKSVYGMNEDHFRFISEGLFSYEGLMISKIPAGMYQFLREVEEAIENKEVFALKFKALELLYRDAIYYDDYKKHQKFFYKKEYIETVSRIRKYIHEHYDEPISIDLLSQEFAINRTYLKEIFANTYGMPVMTYLRNIRMQKAAEFLEDDEMRIIDIAGKLGYSNPSKFSKAFLEYHGVLPSEIRKGRKKEKRKKRKTENKK